MSHFETERTYKFSKVNALRKGKRGKFFPSFQERELNLIF
jgi:hypothetical protein